MLLLMLMLFIFISFLIFIMNLIISKKMYKDFEKSSSFECGFLLMSQNRLPFSIQFYLISILFLIFDVEIIFLFPMIKLMNYISFFEWLFMNFFILIILFLGLEFEKKEGSLKWVF